MGIQINGQNDTVSASDGSINISGEITATVLNQTVTGVTTFSDVEFTTGVNVSGVVTASTGLNVGVTTFHSTSAFVHDINSTGVITATSFSGDGSSLSGIDATTLKDSGGTIRVQANTSGAVVSGMITVGNSFIKDEAVGLGTTTTAARDAGIGTAPGTLIYNASLEKVQLYKQNRGWVDVNDAGDSLTEFSATGGITGEYTDPGTGKHYKTHTYTSSGTFDYIAEYAGVAPVDIIMVGGGGGGAWGGGGGGAGGFIRTTSTPLGSVPGPASITVTIGGGGLGAGYGAALVPPSTAVDQQGGTGGNTVLSNPDNPAILTAYGGGGGMRPGTSGSYPGTMAAGGSGGGSGHTGPSQNNPGPATQPGYTAPNPAINSSIQQNLGYAGGGPGPGTYTGGGGGGAGGAGGASQPGPGYNDGGAGVTQTYEGGPGNPVAMAGGGGGGCYPTGSSVGGSGIGGSSTVNQAGTSGMGGTGSGGAGGPGNGNYYLAGNGGGGYCTIRYEVSAAPTATKATGGIVSFFGGKTIHLFLKSGTFTAPGTFSETVEYVVIAGGGGGGSYQGAGGGAGGYRTGSTPVTGPSPMAVAIGAGGASGVQGSSPMVFPAAGGVGQTDGQNGGPSSWNSITSTGGGGGGAAYQGAGRPGGSGGGGGGSHPPGTPGPGGAGNTPPTSPSQGNNGQSGGTTSNSWAGGGGGAGEPGGNSGTNDGGDGVQLPATFRCPTYEPTNTTNPQTPLRGGGIGSPGPSGKYWVAGGGAGMAYAPVTVPAAGWPEGGVGGGGAGSYSAYSPPLYWEWNEISGMVNSGGGGGGSTNKAGGGGSGVVILAYPT